MLTREERAKVQAALGSALAAEVNYKDLLVAVFPTDYEMIQRAVPLGETNVDTVAAFVLSTVIASGWTKNPVLLDLLLSHLTLRGEPFQPELDRVRRREDPNPNQYDRAWMSGGRPFFGRAQFRDYLELLADQDAQAILRITSQDDAWGRSYGIRFAQHLSNQLGNIQVVSVELSAKTGPSYRPEDLAAAIASQLALGAISPPRASSNYAAEAAQWIAGELLKKPGRWLVVLDGFGQAITDEVRETIEAFAKLVLMGQFNKRLRLVLIDYGRDLPTVSTAEVLEEHLEPVTAISPVQVEACLRELNDERGDRGEVVLAPAELLVVANGLLAMAPTSGKGRVENLNENLIRLSTASAAEIMQAANNGG
jgi:hypothetical protein